MNNAQKSPEHSAPGQTTEIPSHRRPQGGTAALWEVVSSVPSPRSRPLDRGGPKPRRQSGSGDSNPEIPRSFSLPLPGSPKPRKHISKSTTSRCARWLGSQSTGRALGAPRTALSPSGRSPSSARASSSSSSIGLQLGTEREAKARLENRRSRDRVRSRDPPRVTHRRAHVNSCSRGGGVFVYCVCWSTDVGGVR